MLKIIHRVNTIERLKAIPTEYGVEIDVRGFGERLFLNHNPLDDSAGYDELGDYLDNFHHAFVVFNVKEAGYEQKVIDMAQARGIEDYFLLDVEFPYLYAATRRLGVRKIAVRYSEAEPIEAVEAQMKDGRPLLDWVWIDTNTRLPLDEDTVRHLAPFKTCLVCPERWGRPEDIPIYAERIKSLGMKLDAVMTAEKYVGEWEKLE